MSATRPRTRLSPAARKEQLLTTAKDMIVAQGLQQFTMESLARHAGVSSPLVYKYFASRQVLLQDLLALELDSFGHKLRAQVASAKNFSETVRVFIASNFEHHAPGNILPILQSQPDIASATAATRKENLRQTGHFLVRSTQATYSLTKQQAELVVSMSSGASIAAAEYSSRHNINRNKAIDMALSYVLAGLQHIAQRSDDPDEP